MNASETNYEKALNQALASAFSSLGDRNPAEVAFNSGAACEKNGSLSLSYLEHRVTVDPARNEVATPRGPADKRTSILVVHYLLGATGEALTGRMVGFKEVPQGALYYEPFRNRVLRPMAGILEKRPNDFEASARKLGGEAAQTGDISYLFRVFPYVTAQYVWYRGEEEIPSDLNILFDAATPAYLATEDIVVMCEEINGKLKALLL